MKNNASFVYTIVLMVGDFLALVAAFVAAFVLRVTLSDTPITTAIPSETYLGIFASLLPFWILIFALLGLYNSNIYERRFSEFGRLLLGSFIGLMLLIFWNFIVVEPIFPAKLIPFYGFGIGFLLLLLFRNLARAFRTLLFGYDVGITRIVIVGNTHVSDELRRELADSRRSGYEVLAVVGDMRRHNHADYATFEDLLEQVDPRRIHGIIQTELYADEERNRVILDYAQEHHISYRFIPGNTELFVGNLDVELFRNSIPVIAVRPTPLFGWGSAVKRMFDIVVGLLMLIPALPVMGFIWLWMILFDHGDPIFKQKRLSRFNNVIHIYKFRTQYHAYNRMTPEEGFIKMGRPELAKKFRANGDFLPDDPRISPLGHFLRATSLDELPQIFNVIKGDLSLIGPRPLEPFEMEAFDRKHMVLSVKAGLTGLAVVSGRRDIPFEERRKLDLYYVQNWSFWMDVVILAKTIRVVLARSGAR